jgi:hypothetical protein
MRIAHNLDHAQPEPDGEATFIVGRLKGAVPARRVDANGANFYAVVARICAHKMMREGTLPEGLRPVTHSSLVRESRLRFNASE